MRASSATSEREAKFDVERDYVAPDLRPLTGGTQRLPEQELRTSYFDTADRRLGRQGITLRHRHERPRGDEASVSGQWTLELPEATRGALVQRRELTWTGAADHPPEAALEVLRGVLRRASLQPLVTMDTKRQRLRVYLPGRSAVLGELDDDSVRVVAGATADRSFRQIELELEAADASPARPVLDALRKSGATPSGRSKLSIAVAGHPGAEAADDGMRRSHKERLVDTVQATLAEDLCRLVVHDCALRSAGHRPDAEDVHQARVAARRLRSDLRTFGPVLDPVWVAHTSEELSWIGKVFGRLRDVDVRSVNLSEQAVEIPDGGVGFGALTEALESERERAAAEAREMIVSERYLTLLDRLDAAVRSVPVLSGAAPAGVGFGPDTEARDALPLLVREPWKSLRRKVRKAGDDPGDEQLHKIRIRAKRLRYAAEAAAPVVGAGAVTTAARAEAIQTLLGDLHDTVTAEAWLREQGGRSREAAFSAGLLTREQQIRRAKLREVWRTEWARLDRPRSTGWLAKRHARRRLRQTSAAVSGR